MSHKQYRTETNCLNCGAEVTGKFCSNCGQENLETRENFFHLAFHFISDYFHFDSKFFRSLIPLFTKPGYLTKEYWQGRRVHYIHPLRLFFFITIIFMISTSLFYQHFGEQFKGRLLENMTFVEVDTTSITLTPEKKQEILEANQIKSERMKAKTARGFDDFFKVIKYVTFMLLPVYALVFKILYRRRRVFYVDHLVYAMHLQSFVYVLMGFVFLLPFIIPGAFDFLIAIVMLTLFFYIGISLHFLYKQVWWKTLIKSILALYSLFFITGMVMVLYAVLDAAIFQ